MILIKIIMKRKCVVHGSKLLFFKGGLIRRDTGHVGFIVFPKNTVLR